MRAGRDEKVKALFGDAWSGPTGPFRVTRGRVHASSVIVSLIASGRRASLRIEHPDAPPSPSPDEADAFTVAAADRGIRVTASCTPACAPGDAAPLRQVAEQIVARYQGDLFVPAPDAPALDSPSAPPSASPAGHGARPAAHLRSPRGARRSPSSSSGPPSRSSRCVRSLRARPKGTPEIARDMALVFAGTIAAACLLTEPGISNWYLDFLPATGRAPPPQGERLGVGAHVFELLPRALSCPGPTAPSRPSPSPSAPRGPPSPMRRSARSRSPARRASRRWPSSP